MSQLVHPPAGKQKSIRPFHWKGRMPWTYWFVRGLAEWGRKLRLPMFAWYKRFFHYTNFCLPVKAFQRHRFRRISRSRLAGILPYFPQCGAMTGGSGEAPPAPGTAAASPLQKPPGISWSTNPPSDPSPGTATPNIKARGMLPRALLTVMILHSFPARFCETGQLIPWPDPLQGGQYGFRRLDRIGKLFFRMGGGHKHSLKLRRSQSNALLEHSGKIPA